ncbi:MAG: ABC transporter ATP-binding protein [Bacteroidota bacterium]
MSIKQTPTNKKINIGLLKRILSYSKPYQKIFFSTIFITITLSAIAIVRPLMINKMLNVIGAIDPSDKNYLPDIEKGSYINYMGLLLLLVLFVETILQFLNINLTSLLGQNILKDMRLQVYSHLLKLKNTYFDQTPVGTIVTRAVSDIESLSDVFSQGFIVIFGDILMLAIFISAMFYTNWLIALVSLSSIPLLFVATNLFKKGIKKTFTEVRNAVAQLNAFINEHLTGMRIIQLFNREKSEYEKFKEINEQHKKANIRSIWYYSVFFPIVEILSAVSISLLIWFAGVNSNQYEIKLGDITFFIMMINMVFRPIRLLADRLNTLQMGVVAAERVFKVIDTTDFIEDIGVKDTNNLSGKIEFKNVWFAYNQEDYVLKNISFMIESGKTVGIIGATGAGKSSIINLISRFYEINKGEILIDDIPIRQYQLKELRKSVGVVLQDVFLFNDTILNNITMDNDDIDEATVIEAAKEIGIHEFIMELPNGYHYQVNERGASLSAGQRQLVAFVRAYIYNPPIFVLDEATSSIDLKTEKLIQKASVEIAKNRTSIIIAHRLTTVSHSDSIIVMDKGEIIEQGDFNFLKNKPESILHKLLNHA